MAAGGPQPWAVCVKDWADRAIAASRTRKHAPGRTGLGRAAGRDALLSDRTVLAMLLRPCDPALPDRRGPRDRQRRRRRRPARAGPRTASGRQAKLPGRYRPAGFAGRGRYLLCSDRLSPVAVDRPHFSVQTLRAAYADALPSWPSWPGLVSMFRLTLYHGARALHARQAGSRSRSPPGTGACRSAAMYGCSDRPRERPPRPSCPMLPDVVAYHRRDNLPGQIRA